MACISMREGSSKTYKYTNQKFEKRLGFLNGPNESHMCQNLKDEYLLVTARLKTAISTVLIRSIKCILWSVYRYYRKLLCISVFNET
jgi:hypothetical protein